MTERASVWWRHVRGLSPDTSSRNVSRSTASCRSSPSAAATARRAFYPLVENVHEDGILRTSRAPAVGRAAGAKPRSTRRRLLDELGYVGVLALELFDAGGRLLANELAPRVHNTGHWTIEGCGDEPVREPPARDPRPAARLDRRRGAVAARQPDRHGAGRAGACSRVPGAHLHLYGKEPRPGRKLGHVTLVEPIRARASARSSCWTDTRLSAASRRGRRCVQPQEGQIALAPLRLERRASSSPEKNIV